MCGVLNPSVTLGLSSGYRPGRGDFKFLVIKNVHSDRLVHRGLRHVKERFIQCTEFGDMWSFGYLYSAPGPALKDNWGGHLSNVMLISEYWIGNDVKRSRLGLILRHCLNFARGTERNTKNIRMVGILTESRNLNLPNISHRLLQLSACMVTLQWRRMALEKVPTRIDTCTAFLYLEWRVRVCNFAW